MAESTLAQAKRSFHLPNILPLLPMGHKAASTYFRADKLDHKVETQQGGKIVNATHLMAFQYAIEDTNVFLNTNDDHQQVPRTKRRRVEYEQGKVPNLINSLFFLWLCLHKWNSYDQTVAIFSGWLTQVREERYPNQHPVKTTEIYLLPLLSKVIEFSTIQ